ncbi:MAG: hypothetical protein KDA85_20690 [Planctomycetaceae bacterium]|nr:hypothetical protein [Planctomycetaceae bacterium]
MKWDLQAVAAGDVIAVTEQSLVEGWEPHGCDNLWRYTVLGNTVSVFEKERLAKLAVEEQRVLPAGFEALRSREALE